MSYFNDRRKHASSEDSSFTVQQGTLMAVIFVAMAMTVQATQPSWWTATGGPLNSNPANDYAAANQGQLKQFTQKAVLYMDSGLSGGAGTPLDSLVMGWSNYYQTNGFSSTNPAPMDLKAVNQGQVKYIANRVYPVLAASGYMSTNYPAWTQTNASDYKVANLGELKKVFAFEFAAPQTPFGLTVLLGSTNATLNWSDPVVSIQNYLLQYSTNGGATWSTLATVSGGTNTTYVTGLLLGTNYLFRVSASNTAGSSSPSTNDAAPIITLANPVTATLVP